MRVPRILLAEDEKSLREGITLNLELEGYEVEAVCDGAEALKVFSEQRFTMVILDVMMPEVNGFEVCEKIRLSDTETPILFLTAKDTSKDKINGLKVGADDYLNKPFDSEVLLHKIKAILQRKETDKTAESEQFEFKIGSFFFNSKLRHLSVGEEGEPSKLSPKESKLLRMLAIHKNDLMPRELALTKIWRDDNYFTSRTMDVYIAKLRKYLKVDENVEILNIHGEGFRLVDKS